MVEVGSREKSAAGSVSYVSGYEWVNSLVTDVRASGTGGAEVERNLQSLCLGDIIVENFLESSNSKVKLLHNPKSFFQYCRHLVLI